MSGYHFFVETNGGEWHRTETGGVLDSAPICSCRIAVDDARVLKVRGHDDDSWQWVPKSQLGACFPKEMRDENSAMVSELHPQESGLDAAIEREVAAVVSDVKHPTRIAYDRARADHPTGGEGARAAFHRYLREEKAKRDAAVDRSAPKAPTVDEKTGVPMCSHVGCPKYARFLGRCTETDDDDPTVCKPAVMDMALELDSRRDAADPAFDEIIKLCGLAKTWEYPGQVVRDVEDALKKKDEEKERAIRRITDQADREVNEYRQKLKDVDAGIAVVVEQNQKLQAALKYARDRRGNHFDFDEWIVQVEHALDNKIPPHAIENAQAKEAQAWAAVSSMRQDRDAARAELRAWLEGMKSPTWQKPSDSKIAAKLAATPDPVARVEEERTKDLHVMTAQGKAIDELRAQNTKLDAALRAAARAVCKNPLLHGSFVAINYEQWADGMRKEIATVDELRDAIVNTHSFILAANEHVRSQLHTAAAIRDDARRASQRYLDEKREVEERLRKAIVDWRLEVDKLEAEKRAIEAAGAELTELVSKMIPTGPQHSRECGTAHRGCAPDCAFAKAQQDACGGAHVFVGDYCRDCGLHAPRVDVDPRDEMIAMADLQNAKENRPPAVTKREDGAYTAGPPPDGRSVDTHLTELTKTCLCSPKYIELAPGVHSKYCPLGGLPLDDGRRRWRCEPCDLTYRSPADTPTQPIASCQQCGKPTTEVVRG